MSGSRSNTEQTSTTNVTTTSNTQTVIGATNSTTVAAQGDFVGEVGITGSDAVRALSDFNNLRRDLAILDTKRFNSITNALASRSGGATSDFSINGKESDEKTPPKNDKLILAATALGGAAALFTILKITK